MIPREAAQLEAERTFDMFILWSKRASIYSVIFLMVVVFVRSNFNTTVTSQNNHH